MTFGQSKKSDFEKISDSVPISKTMLRFIYGCQKWIPDKISHRNVDPIFSLFFIFSSEKNDFENEKLATFF